MNPGLLMQLERLRHRPGQMLRSADFNRALDLQAQRQWWHNRALHQSFGVVSGFELRTVWDNGQQVVNPSSRVSPGLAYDGFGRELCLQSPARLPPVPRGGEPGQAWMLLAAYAERDALPMADSVGCRRRIETPCLVWHPSRRVAASDGVPIAQVLVYSDRIVVDEAFQRPLQRPLARPRVGSGSTPLGKTDWRIRRTNEPTSVTTIELTIDTSSSGFMERPCYVATLRAPRPQSSFDLLWLIFPRFVSDAGARSFVSSIMVPVYTPWTVAPADWSAMAQARSGSGWPAPSRWLELARQHVHLTWLGVEPPPNRRREGGDHVHD